MDQGFARFACDHGLEFAGGERVDVTRFTGHKQQDLGSRQGGEFIGLGKEKEENSSIWQRAQAEIWFMDYLHLIHKVISTGKGI